MATQKYGGKIYAWSVAAVWAGLGLALNEPAWIAFAMTFASVFSVAADLRRPDGFGPSTIWATSMALTGLADGAGMLVTNPDVRDLFFVYAAQEHLARAEAITFVGSGAILFGFALANLTGPHRNILPGLAVQLASEAVWGWVLVTGVVVLVLQLRFVQFGNGTFSSLYGTGVPLVVFVLAREASRCGSRKWLWAAALLAYAGATRAVFFEVLRALILLPIAALILGCLVGARGLKPFRQLPLLPMYAGLAIFFLFFQTFGEERATAGYGLERVQEMAARRDDAARQGQATSAGSAASLARQTSFNQVSQIVRLTQTDGFEYGSTLDYFAYVFIPRFVWPDKPIIAKGRWFAERLGFGMWRVDGGFTNSINMTVPGEWYLNFGWPGTIIGGVLVGFCMGLFWNAGHFWSGESAPLVGAYGFSILAFTWQLNVDTEVIPSVVSLYLVFLVSSRLLRVVTLRSRSNSRIRSQKGRPVFSRIPTHTP